MIFKMPIIQLEQYWEAIKLAALSADEIKPEDINVYCIELITNILNENYIVLISFNEEKRIKRILIIAIAIDKETNHRGMFFKVIYSFIKGSAEDWDKDSAQVLKFAKDQGCEFISATISNKALVGLATRSGFIPTSTNYVLKL